MPFLPLESYDSPATHCTAHPHPQSSPPKMRDDPGPISAALGSKKKNLLSRPRPPTAPSSLLFRSFSPSQRDATSLPSLPPSLPKKPRSVGRSMGRSVGLMLCHSAARFRDFGFNSISEDCFERTHPVTAITQRGTNLRMKRGRKGAKIWAGAARDRDHLDPNHDVQRKAVAPSQSVVGQSNDQPKLSEV